jgi:AmmeMemoRadiSam system protein B
VEGREVICLRDPSGVTDAVVSLSRPALEIVALFDGQRSLVEVQGEVMRRRGTLVTQAELEGLVEALDRNLFLDSPRLIEERTRQGEAFRASPVRAAFHAGKAYAGDPDKLAESLAGYLADPGGPGAAGTPGQSRLRGLIAPHIDLHRGGPAYAWAYRTVIEAEDVDCFVVLGTAHAGLDGQPFAATRKAYATPFGPVPVDAEVLEAMVAGSPVDLFAAELAHRAEHSIELQAVCLRWAERARRRGREVRFVPLLASFVHECLAARRSPDDVPAVAGALDALSAAMARVPRRYCVVAGADLAHMGPRFGDPAPVSAEELVRIEAEDRALLETATAGDARAFFEAARSDGDRRRTCGLSPIYATLRLLGGGVGRLLRYGQWPDPAGVVTYASIAFTGEPG